MKYLFTIIIVLASFYAVSHLTQTVEAADAVSDAMNMTINMGNLDEPKQVAGIVKILLVMTSFTFLPGLLMVMTSFTRIIIVLSFARKALSAQQMPPNQILIGLAILITFFVMAPVFSQINEKAIQPFMQEEIEQGEAFNRGMGQLKTFMVKQTREKDLALFYNISKMDSFPNGIRCLFTIYRNRYGGCECIDFNGYVYASSDDDICTV
jgi:flagellar biosynthetic protein FliP